MQGNTLRSQGSTTGSQDRRNLPNPRDEGEIIMDGLAGGTILDGVAGATFQCQRKTLLVIQNGTPSPLTLCKTRYWAGYGNAPDIKYNLTAQFTHFASGSSIGALVYIVESCNQECRWVIAWSNRPNHSNQVYTKILNACERIDFDEIRAKLQQASSKSYHKNSSLSACLVIDMYASSPTLTAVLTRTSDF
ncbi:hypothetical protein DITRI_Ditri13aG0151000 [Diplodiscus trichospermus]